jgi:hypothetical protein
MMAGFHSHGPCKQLIVRHERWRDFRRRRLDSFFQLVIGRTPLIGGGVGDFQAGGCSVRHILPMPGLRSPVIAALHGGDESDVMPAKLMPKAMRASVMRCPFQQPPRFERAQRPLSATNALAEPLAVMINCTMSLRPIECSKRNQKKQPTM